MLAAITLALSLATTAHAASYWLDPGGDDAADGSREAPWRTLARACPALEAGDALTLMPGSYPGTLAVSAQGTAEAPIVVRAFSTPRQGSRMVIVAPTPAAEPPTDLLVGDWRLLDDEQWHEVTLDARIIREKYPEVQVLEGMRIGAMSREQVAEGDWYEIDEVVIGPAE
jgi:hypothetical protein